MNKPGGHWKAGLFVTLSPFCSLSRKFLNTAHAPLLSVPGSQTYKLTSPVFGFPDVLPS